MKTMCISARGAILAAVVAGMGGNGFAVTMLPFTPTNPIGGAPVGWSYAGNKFVGTVLGDGVGRMYSTDLTGGSVAPFGGTVNLLNGHGQEHYVSSSIGLGGFPVGDIYVASNNNIQHLTNAGVADPGLFISGSSGGLTGLVRGITFDAVGTFGNQMLVTTDQGFVYTVSSAGVATQIASTGEDTEGLDVAPLTGGTWGSMNGWLFVASEGSGTIRAIKPVSFAVVPVATVPSGEELDFVPLNLGASGNPLEGLYGANYNANVLHAGAPDFAGMQGDIIVTSELLPHTISRVSFGGGVTTVGSFPNQPEDGLFVTAGLIQALNGPEPTTLGLLGVGSLLMVGRRRRVC